MRLRPASTLFYGILVIVIGVLLVMFHSNSNLLSWVVILAGISLVIPCLYTLLSTVSGERRERRQGYTSVTSRMMNFGTILTSVIGIAIGIWLIVAPNFFIGFIAYAFAVLLIIYGLYHICVVAWICQPLRLPVWYYIIPLLLIGAGLVILLSSVRQIQSTVILITGIGLIGAGISSLLEYVAAYGSRTTTLK